MSDLWSVIVAYLLGAIPTGYLLVRLVQGRNIQKIGSGNIGVKFGPKSTGQPISIIFR